MQWAETRCHSGSSDCRHPVLQPAEAVTCAANEAEDRTSCSAGRLSGLSSVMPRTLSSSLAASSCAATSSGRSNAAPAPREHGPSGNRQVLLA
jgi:hypothetical protein